MRAASIILAGASVVAATALPAEAASQVANTHFHITGFNTLCDAISPGQTCVSNFNVTYNGGTVPCTVKSTDNKYVFCSTDGPEMAQYAYIKGGKKGSSGTLELKFITQFPGGPTNTTYGSKVLPGKQTFNVPVTKMTSVPSGSG